MLKGEREMDGIHSLPIEEGVVRTDNLLITCIDYRIERGIRDFLESDIIAGTSDVFAYPGASLEFELNREVMIDNIKLFCELHGINCIFILDHELCGAVCNHINQTHMQVTGPDVERNIHVSLLNNAKLVIKQYFPHMLVKTYLYRQNGDIVEVE